MPKNRPTNCPEDIWKELDDKGPENCPQTDSKNNTTPDDNDDGDRRSRNSKFLKKPNKRQSETQDETQEENVDETTTETIVTNSSKC